MVSMKESSATMTGASSSTGKAKAAKSKYNNPFRMPSDDEVFAMREAERQAKAEVPPHSRTLVDFHFSYFVGKATQCDTENS
jgi:hypothetical protein